MLLSELLNTYNGKYQIELVAFNGEDYYAVSGQMKYIEQNRSKFNDIVLNINIDGVGYIEGLTCISAFNLSDDMQAKLNEVIQSNPSIIIGQPWYQGDHSIFIQNGCPALAISSDWFIRNMESQDITHTSKDNLNIVNFERIPECVIAIKNLINALEEK